MPMPADHPSLESDPAKTPRPMFVRAAGVYAGAYLHGRVNTALNHAVLFDVKGCVVRALCRRPKPENISDDSRAPEPEMPVTCEPCRARVRRLMAEVPRV